MCVESGGQNCWLWLFTLQIGWKMGWQGVVRRAKIVALHREAPQHPVGCPFAEEVVEHCRAEATRLTKPPCPSGERFPFSHSNGRPQCVLGSTQPLLARVVPGAPGPGQDSLSSHKSRPLVQSPKCVPPSSQNLEGFQVPFPWQQPWILGAAAPPALNHKG